MNKIVIQVIAGVGMSTSIALYGPLSSAELVRIKDEKGMPAALQAGVSVCALEMAGVNIASILGSAAAGAALPVAGEFILQKLEPYFKVLRDSFKQGTQAEVAELPAVVEQTGVGHGGSPSQLPRAIQENAPLVTSINVSSSSGQTVSNLAHIRQIIVNKLQDQIVRPLGMSVVDFQSRIGQAVDSFLQHLPPIGPGLSQEGLFAKLTGTGTAHLVLEGDPYIVRLGNYINVYLYGPIDDIASSLSGISNMAYVDPLANVQAGEVSQAMARVKQVLRQESAGRQILSGTGLEPVIPPEPMSVPGQVTVPVAPVIPEVPVEIAKSVVNQVEGEIVQRVAQLLPVAQGESGAVHTVIQRGWQTLMVQKSPEQVVRILAQGSPGELQQLSVALKDYCMQIAKGAVRDAMRDIDLPILQNTLSNLGRSAKGGNLGAEVQQVFNQLAARRPVPAPPSRIIPPRMPTSTPVVTGAGTSVTTLARAGAATGSVVGLATALGVGLSQAGACYQRVLDILGITVLPEQSETRAPDLATKAYLYLHNQTGKKITVTLYRVATPGTLVYIIPADVRQVVIPLDGVFYEKAICQAEGGLSMGIAIYRLPYVTQVLSGSLIIQSNALILDAPQGINFFPLSK
jgi:hypothetical protein